MLFRSLYVLVPFLVEAPKVSGCFSTVSKTCSPEQVKMAQPKRYFINMMDDFKGGEVVIPKDVIRERLNASLNNILLNQGKTLHECDGGLYVGISGVAYMFYYMSTVNALAERRQDYLKHAEGYMDVAMQYCRSDTTNDPAMKCGFLLGNAGVRAVAALLANALGKTEESNALLKEYAGAAETCVPIKYLRRGADEMFIGRSGYLAGLLLLNRNLGVEVLGKQATFAICSAVVNSGREYARKVRSPSPLMYSYYDTEYLGAAHGLSAILQVLLSFPEFLQSQPAAENDVRGAVDFMLSLQQANGNFPTAMDEVGSSRRTESEELVHWCHGAPGVVYLMAKAYLHWRDEKYLQACLKSGELVWKRGLLRKGPGTCHGVAGNGYVFLLLYRLTGDDRHLYRALKFADFMFTDEFRMGARTPDNPYSLFEGLAGTACYLADLLQPDKAEFPFFNVF